MRVSQCTYRHTSMKAICLSLLLFSIVAPWLAQARNLRQMPPRKPEVECASMGSHNRFREANHMGCLERATLAYSAWRKRCKEVASDAEHRAAELVMELATSQERKISDHLIDEAVSKRRKSFDRAQSRYEARRQRILRKCDAKLLVKESSSDCVERLTQEAEQGDTDSLDLMEAVNDHLTSLIFHMKNNSGPARVMYELRFFNALCDDFGVA